MAIDTLGAPRTTHSGISCSRSSGRHSRASSEPLPPRFPACPPEFGLDVPAKNRRSDLGRSVGDESLPSAPCYRISRPDPPSPGKEYNFLYDKKADRFPDLPPNLPYLSKTTHYLPKKILCLPKNTPWLPEKTHWLPKKIHHLPRKILTCPGYSSSGSCP